VRAGRSKRAAHQVNRIALIAVRLVTAGLVHHRQRELRCHWSGGLPNETFLTGIKPYHSTPVETQNSFCSGSDTFTAMRDIETIDSELHLVAALRRAAQERGGSLPSIDVADALLDERCDLTGS
jgi:hypothetical protein